MYDVYYTTGGGPWVNAGSDTWVNIWLKEIAPKLKIKPILILHRNKPKGFDDFKFPIEAYWHGDDTKKVEEICRNARRINILHGHYTPMKVLEENINKIHSNVLHNSVDHIIKSQIGTDASLAWHPYLDSSWEQKINENSIHNIWVGLFDILTPNINIPNFYEFKHNKRLSKSNLLGFTARCEGRKNPHYLDKLNGFVFTNSREFKLVWKNGTKMNCDNLKIYHYKSEFKNTFYDLDWGISHSAFTNEPFGYSIFEAVDRGKLPILHTSWCKNFEYPYRASNKKEFNDTYNKLIKTPYTEKELWFLKLKDFMQTNYSDKKKWIKQLLDIYNI